MNQVTAPHRARLVKKILRLRDRAQDDDRVCIACPARDMQARFASLRDTQTMSAPVVKRQIASG